MSKTMKNQIKSVISYGLILLAILAFGAIALIQVKTANAEEDFGVYHGYGYNETTRNPSPVVHSINPKSANVGSGSLSVNITGAGFVPRSVARWNGSDRPTTFIDSSHLVVHLNSSDINGSSGRYINVWNPSPGGGYSSAAFFTINGYVAPSGSSNSGNSSNTSNSTSRSSSGNSSNTGNVQGESDTNEIPTTEDYSALASNAIFGSDSFMPSGLMQWLLFAIFVLLVVIIVRKIFFADKYHSTPLKHA